MLSTCFHSSWIYSFCGIHWNWIKLKWTYCWSDSPTYSGSNVLFVMRVLFCVCVCRETMQQPGCTTSEPCFWALVPNSWRKTWPSWTDWRGDWQGGRRQPWSTRCCTILGTDQGSGAPPSPLEPKYQPPGCWIKLTWLLRWPACVWAEEEGQDPVFWGQGDWSSHRSLSWGKQKGMAGWRPLEGPCIAPATSALLQHAHLL